jgi:hypothetical protein
MRVLRLLLFSASQHTMKTLTFVIALLISSVARLAIATRIDSTEQRYGTDPEKNFAAGVAWPGD